MSAAIAFRGWAPEAGPEVGVSASIGSVIPGVCCCWALGDDEWRMKNLRIAKSQGRPNRQLASDMGCDRGNLTRRPLPACAWCAPPVNLIKIKATSLLVP